MLPVVIGIVIVEVVMKAVVVMVATTTTVIVSCSLIDGIHNLTDGGEGSGGGDKYDGDDHFSSVETLADGRHDELLDKGHTD